jgi:hypothetical protein
VRSDEDLLMLTMEVNVGTLLKNQVLGAVTERRAALRAQAEAQQGDEGGDGDGAHPTTYIGSCHGDCAHIELEALSELVVAGDGGVGALQRVREALEEAEPAFERAQAWFDPLACCKRPHRCSFTHMLFLRFMAVWCFWGIWMAIYFDGLDQVAGRTALTDAVLKTWAEENGVRELTLHGPCGGVQDSDTGLKLSKTFRGLPPHVDLRLRARMWIVGDRDSFLDVAFHVIIDGKKYDDSVVPLPPDGDEDENGFPRYELHKQSQLGQYSGPFHNEFGAHAAELPRANRPEWPPATASYADIDITVNHMNPSVQITFVMSTHPPDDNRRMILVDAVSLTLRQCTLPPGGPSPSAPVINSAEQAQVDAQRRAWALGNCTFLPGEGVGTADEFVERSNGGPSACARTVLAQHPNADGATFSAPHSNEVWDYAEDGAVAAGWSNGNISQHGQDRFTRVHGPFARNAVRRDVPIPAGVDQCIVRWRYFFLGRRDGERDTVRINGIDVWHRTPNHRNNMRGCAGQTGAKWHNAEPQARQWWSSDQSGKWFACPHGGSCGCYEDVQVQVPCTGSLGGGHSPGTMRIEFSSALAHELEQEAWAFSNVQVMNAVWTGDCWAEYGMTARRETSDNVGMAKWLSCTLRGEIRDAPLSAWSVRGDGDGGAKTQQCDVTTSQRRVRCCADTALPSFTKATTICPWADSDFAGNSGYHCEAGDYERAVQICAAHGARLCTLQEILGECTQGTGCGYDSKQVWTSTACERCDTVPGARLTTRTPNGLSATNYTQEVRTDPSLLRSAAVSLLLSGAAPLMLGHAGLVLHEVPTQ